MRSCVRNVSVSFVRVCVCDIDLNECAWDICKVRCVVLGNVSSETLTTLITPYSHYIGRVGARFPLPTVSHLSLTISSDTILTSIVCTGASDVGI